MNDRVVSVDVETDRGARACLAINADARHGRPFLARTLPNPKGRCILVIGRTHHALLNHFLVVVAVVGEPALLALYVDDKEV